MTGPSPAVLAVLGRGLIDARTPVLRADDAGVTRADGCFEGCRLVAGEVAKLDRHLARLGRSAAVLAIPYDQSAIAALVGEAVAAWTGGAEAAVKIVLTRGPADGPPSAYVSVGSMPADYAALRRDGLAVITLPRGYAADTFATAPWLLGGVKTLAYAVNMAAQREAVRRGAHDALFVSTEGFALEAPTASLVWSVDRTLSTTATGATGILAGTTQQVLFENAAAAGWAVRETLAPIEQLHAADVIWLVSSVRGPIDVIELDGRPRVRRPDIDAEVRKLAGF